MYYDDDDDGNVESDDVKSSGTIKNLHSYPFDMVLTPQLPH